MLGPKCSPIPSKKNPDGSNLLGWPWAWACIWMSRFKLYGPSSLAQPSFPNKLNKTEKYRDSEIQAENGCPEFHRHIPPAAGKIIRNWKPPKPHFFSSRKETHENSCGCEFCWIFADCAGKAWNRARIHRGTFQFTLQSSQLFYKFLVLDYWILIFFY